MDAPASALTVLLFGFAGLFLFVAASSWLRLIRDPKHLDEKRALSVDRLQSTATATAIALGTLAAAVLWFAVLTLSGISER